MRPITEALAIDMRKPRHRPLSVLELPTPVGDECGDFDVLTRVVHNGLCGTDNEMKEGPYGSPPDGEDHLILVHEAVVEAVAFGPRVSGINVGDRFVPLVRIPGGCPACTSGNWHLCLDGKFREAGIGGQHGFGRRHAIISRAQLVPIKRFAPSLNGTAVLGEPSSIADHAVAEAIKVGNSRYDFLGFPWFKSVKRALVVGAGPVGLLIALRLRMEGVAEVTVVDRFDGDHRKRRVVTQMGAFYTSQSLDELADRKQKFQLVIDASGNAEAALRAELLLERCTVMVRASVTDGDSCCSVPGAQINGQCVLESRTVIGIVNANAEHQRGGLRMLEWAHHRYPGLLEMMLSHPIKGFGKAVDMWATTFADKGPDTIKATIDVG